MNEGGYPEELRREVDRYLSALSFSSEKDTSGLEEAMRYSLLAPGKRIRPVLCLATAKSLGLDMDGVMPAAAALEMIHTYSLIHDDLPALDDDELRRNMPTCHIKFGEDVAILAGDALYAEAFILIVEELDASLDRKIAVLREIARATGAEGMVGGQFIDVTRDNPMDETELRRMHALKTGRLIEASISCAVSLSGKTNEAVESLGAFAKELGVLFQIVDDILDVVGSEEELGKATGSDERLQKHTYVSTFGLERARELASNTYRDASETLDRAGGDVEGLREIAKFIYSRSR